MGMDYELIIFTYNSLGESINFCIWQFATRPYFCIEDGPHNDVDKIENICVTKGWFHWKIDEPILVDTLSYLYASFTMQ